ncbi:hypothetical protein FRC11_007739 [Ceratobasidium sp. 423]|nr:hypothetical protein FRC11_007739 [Ceratobasidium sp. 423]
MPPNATSQSHCTHAHDMLAESCVGTVHAALNPCATAWDGPPLYCMYSGPIQGVWKQRHNIELIVSNYRQHHHLKACVAYSWTEAHFVLAASQSFKDILESKGGWPLLYWVLLDIFGDEGAFILGPELVSRLGRVCAEQPQPESSLLQVLEHARENASMVSELLTYLPQAHTPRLWAQASTVPDIAPNLHLQGSRITRTMYWKPFYILGHRGLLVLSNEVCKQMVLIDNELLAQLNPSSSTHNLSEGKDIMGGEASARDKGDNSRTQRLALGTRYVEIDLDVE